MFKVEDTSAVIRATTGDIRALNEFPNFNIVDDVGSALNKWVSLNPDGFIAANGTEEVSAPLWKLADPDLVYGSQGDGGAAYNTFVGNTNAELSYLSEVGMERTLQQESKKVLNNHPARGNKVY